MKREHTICIVSVVQFHINRDASGVAVTVNTESANTFKIYYKLYIDDRLRVY